jgi:hypothetical protein
MATVIISKRPDGVVNAVSGSLTGDAAANTINCGFIPLHVIVINETDAIRWEKIDPMVAANTLKTVTAGTTTVDTGSAIVINTDGTVTLSATLAASGKALKFICRR